MSSLFAEPCVDGGVVVAADTEGCGGKLAALLEGRLGALSVQDIQQGLVLLLGGNDDDVVEVLGTCADEADAADVDLLDDVGFAGTAGHGLLKGIEVNDDEVDFGNLVFRHLLAVAFQVAATEDATEDFG